MERFFSRAILLGDLGAGCSGGAGELRVVAAGEDVGEPDCGDVPRCSADVDKRGSVTLPLVGDSGSAAGAVLSVGAGLEGVVISTPSSTSESLGLGNPSVPAPPDCF